MQIRLATNSRLRLPKRLLLGRHFAGPNFRSWELPLGADRSALSEKFEWLTAGDDQMLGGFPKCQPYLHSYEGD